MNKRTLVIGASTNPARIAFIAVNRLVQEGHEVIPIGINAGEIGGIKINDLNQRPPFENIDTITLYINPGHQVEWEDYILSLKPRRLIFNPGSENPSLGRKAAMSGIKVEHSCTLVLLTTKQY